MSAFILVSLLTLLGSKYPVAHRHKLKKSAAQTNTRAFDLELARLSDEQGLDVDSSFDDDLLSSWTTQVTDFLNFGGWKRAPAPSPATPPAINPNATNMYSMCEQLCEEDPEPDYCMTDCHTYVDNGGDLTDLQDFVTDNTYNEKGGDEMESTFETMTGVEVAGCEPEVDVTQAPSFSDMDANSDGSISLREAQRYGLQMCIPDDMVAQIFTSADVNMDRALAPREFEHGGERTDMEQALDFYLDNLVEGDDQYKRVQLPPFKDFDEDGDGMLNDAEVEHVWKFEVRRRIPMLKPEDMSKEMDIIKNRFSTEFYKRIDLDGDGEISLKEYNRGKHGGLGVEFSEAAKANEDMHDSDDPSNPAVLPPDPVSGPVVQAQAPAPAPAPPPGVAAPMFLRRRMHSEGDKTGTVVGHVIDLERKMRKHKHHRRHHHHFHREN